jgi:hypothetical protein
MEKRKFKEGGEGKKVLEFQHRPALSKRQQIPHLQPFLVKKIGTQSEGYKCFISLSLSLVKYTHTHAKVGSASSLIYYRQQ